MHCIWCGVRRDYYDTAEHASRQNCGESDCGYHEFSHFASCIRVWNALSWLVHRKRRSEHHYDLLRHERQTRSHTI